MKKVKVLLCMGILFVYSNAVFAQSKANDIPSSQLPAEVKAVLTEYVTILSTSKDLDECEKRMASIAGGGLVNESVENTTLRKDIKPYSLKKDFQNIKFYKSPIVITRVNKNPTMLTDGYGASAIRGTHYKIWIAKKDGVAGLPAPISIMVPDNHPTIKSPKVIGIGSL